jgi:hypothetical protein
LQVRNEPDVAEREDLRDRQIGVPDRPRELRANLIDGTQQRVIERRRFIRGNRDRLQKTKVRLIRVQRPRALLRDRLGR